MQDEVYFGLNASGRAIWEMLCDDNATFESVVERLAERFPDVPHGVLRADTDALLEQLTSLELVQSAQ